MANSYEPFVDAITHVPTGMEHPVLTGFAVAAVVGGGYLAQQYMSSHRHEQGAVDVRRNQAAILASQIGTAKETDKQRFSPVAKTFIGLGFLALQFVGQPTYETTVPNPNAETVVVADVSNSMYYGHDVGGTAKDTRSSVAIDALKQSQYTGLLGFVQTASTNKIISKPVKNWRPLIKEFGSAQVDPNGGQLIPALDRASSLLSENPATHKRDGTILVISDGTINESAADLTTEAAKLQKAGITLRVVVPGTANGGYRLPGTTTQVLAGAEPGRFNGFGSDVRAATNVGAINQAVQSQLESAGKSHERHGWPVPGELGALALVLAFGQFSKRVITRH